MVNLIITLTLALEHYPLFFTLYLVNTTHQTWQIVGSIGFHMVIIVTIIKKLVLCVKVILVYIHLIVIVTMFQDHVLMDHLIYILVH